MWCLGEELVWPPTDLGLLGSYSASGAQLLSSGGRRGGWGRCSWVVRMAHMLKDLVDYFKLEEINIDNWTFKLYYKVFLHQYVIKYSKHKLDLRLLWFCHLFVSINIGSENCFYHRFQIDRSMMACFNICQKCQMCQTMFLNEWWTQGQRCPDKQQILLLCWQKADFGFEIKFWLWIISGLCGDMHGRSNHWHCQPVLWRSHQVIRNVHGEKVGWWRKGQFGLLRFGLMPFWAPARGWDADVLHLPYCLWYTSRLSKELNF